jgi:hypothetical protein|tara:strand:+ start:1206 stop:1619 length:414 start_codon:yes stop_codon:yes gene_type:complete
MEQEDIFRGVGVEVTLPTPDSFLKIKETLTRIGISSRKDKKLFQSCHILHKKGRYSILHFKELFILDGKHNTFTEEDHARRNTIVNLLEEWELVKIVDAEKTKDPVASLNQIKIISYKEKDDWELTVKYNIGTSKSS